MKIRINGPSFYSQGDEDAFFAWLNQIRFVDHVEGFLQSLIITLKVVSRDDLQDSVQELQALCRRYEISQKSVADQLAPIIEQLRGQA